MDEQKRTRVVWLWLGRAGATFLIVVGLHAISTVVDVAPYLGTPQIDYPAFDIDLPFWPQFLFGYGGPGLAGAFVAALSLYRLSATISLPRLGVIICGAVTAGRLGWDASLYPLPWSAAETLWRARHAAVNGLASAAVVVICYGVVRLLLGRTPRSPPWFRFLTWSASTASLFLATAAILDLAGDLLGPGWLKGALLISAVTAPVIGILAATAPVPVGAVARG